MAYNEYDERDMELDRSSELYDQDPYESEFGERVDNTSLDDEAMSDNTTASDAYTEGSTSTATPESNRLEDDFGETLATNPHLEDQLEDQQLASEAESDYSEKPEKKDESLLDKAKDKMSEWTGGDKDR